MRKAIPISIIFLGISVLSAAGYAQGNFWECIGDSTTNLVWGLAIDAGDVIYAGGNELFCSTDHGGSWRDLHVDLEGGLVDKIEVNSLGHIFANIVYPFGTSGGLLKRSTDKGVHWIKLPMWGGMLAIDDSNHIFVRAGEGDGPAMLRSTDNGDTWDTVGSGLPRREYGMYRVYALAFHPTGDVFASSSGGGVHHSSDHATSFHSEVNNLTNSQVRFLTVAPGGDLYGITSNGVFRSTDKDGSWTFLYSTPSWPKAMLCTANGDLFVGAGEWGPNAAITGGVIKNGLPVNAGLSFLSVEALALDSRGYLFASTWGGGIFRSKQAVTTIDETRHATPSEFVLEQNYPNPFNPSTTIRYSLPHRSYVTLAVFNMLGQQVATLVNGNIEAGYHRVQFDASTFASGVYFYRLQAEGFTQTKSLCILK